MAQQLIYRASISVPRGMGSILAAAVDAISSEVGSKIGNSFLLV